MQVTTPAYDAEVVRIANLATQKYSSIQKEAVHAPSASIASAIDHLPSELPTYSATLQNTFDHLINAVCPSLSNSTSPRYFGFVTGGSNPAAQLADLLAAIYDQNVQVHLPTQSISTTVEHNALCMLLELLQLNKEEWTGRTFTTGATASNILGLACGRNHVLKNLGICVSEDGFQGTKVEVLCVSAHASIQKAASIVGIGRANCIDLSDTSDPWKVSFNLKSLEDRLIKNKRDKVGTIIVASFGEVNTGLTTLKMNTIKSLCTDYDAWLHIDAAFAVFAGLHPPLSNLLRDLQYADSICADAHKWLNVPYDCAMFFTRHKPILKDVCSGGTAPYLSTSETDGQEIESPLHIGIENSRRFRALSVYASLLTYGRTGYAEMVRRNIEFTRSVDAWMRGAGARFFDVLTPVPAKHIGDNLILEMQENEFVYETANVVLFAVKPEVGDMKQVVEKINRSGMMYVTGTTFNGRASARMAVSNWRTGLKHIHEGMVSTEEESDEDLTIVIDALIAAVS